MTAAGPVHPFLRLCPPYARLPGKPARPPFACRLGAGFVLYWEGLPEFIPGRGEPPTQRSSTDAAGSPRGESSGKTASGRAGAAAGGAGAGGGAAGGSHGAAGSGACPHSVRGIRGSPRSFRSCSSFLQAERKSRSAAAS